LSEPPVAAGGWRAKSREWTWLRRIPRISLGGGNAGLIDWRPLLWVGFLTALIAAPWLRRGYIFGTDFPGPRHFPFPDNLISSTPLSAILALAAHVLPAQSVGKLLIVGSLFTAGFAAYRSVPLNAFLLRASASVVYMINPFTYGRLHYGQLFLLAGYAVFPWVAKRIRCLLVEPRWATAAAAGGSLAVLGSFDLHLLLPGALLAIALAFSHIVARHSDPDYLRRLAPNLAFCAAVFVLISAYWLIPLLNGTSVQAQIIAGITQADLQAFKTVGDPALGLLPNVLGLYGFWGETTGWFTQMKDFVPGWPLALAIILVLAALGMIAVLQNRPQVQFQFGGSWVTGLVLAGLGAIVLDVGISETHVAVLVNWLQTIVPPYRGMRDAEKWATLLAFAYAQLVPLGVASLAGWRTRLVGRELRLLSEPLVAAFALALPLYYGNGLLFGAHGQIVPSDYPSGWYQADQALVRDTTSARALFLPWHLYMDMSFVRNANSLVASPAPTFFSIPIVSSRDAEVPGVEPPRDPEQQAIGKLVAQGRRADWASQLAPWGVKYVLLAKEADWQDYDYLDGQSGLVRVADFNSIILYSNQLWSPLGHQTDVPRTAVRFSGGGNS
jgi:hypothetical protein